MKNLIKYLFCCCVAFAAVECSLPQTSISILEELTGKWVESNDSDEGISAIIFNDDNSSSCNLLVRYDEDSTTSLLYNYDYDYPYIHLFPQSNTETDENIMNIVKWLQNQILTGVVAINDTNAEKANIELQQLEELLQENEQWKNDEVARIQRLTEQGIISEEQADAEIQTIKSQFEEKQKQLKTRQNALDKALQYPFTIVLNHPVTGIIGQFWH